MNRAPADRAAPSTAVARGALALLSTQPLTWTASLLAAVLVPRYLGAQAVGEYATAVTLAGLVGSVVSLGVPNALVRRVARDRTSAADDASGAVSLLLLLAGLGAVATFAAVLALGPPVPRVELVALALAGLVVGAVQNVLFAVLNGQGRHARYAWLNALSAVAATGAGLAVLVLGYSVVEFMAASLLVSAAATAASWRLSHLAVRRAAIGIRRWRDLAREGLPFLRMNLTLQARGEADRLFLAILSGAQTVGWYAAAHRIAAIPIFIPTLVTTPLLPALSRLADDRAAFRETVGRSVIAVLSLTVPISALQVVVAPAIPDLLGWGRAFEPSIPLMMILALQQPLVALDMVLATALVALDRERAWSWCLALATVLGCGANLVLIPWFDATLGNGAIGAAVTSLGVELILFGAAVSLLRGAVYRRTLDRPPAGRRPERSGRP